MTRYEYGIAVIVLSLAACALLAGCTIDSGKNPRGAPAETITVAYSPFESTALFWVAEDRGFFRDNGITINLKKYDSGSAALDAVINGEADLCVGTTEFPLVGKVFQGVPVRALATIDKGEFIYLVANGDRIRNVSDLRGKHIGTTRGTIADFHLGRYLMLHGIPVQEIVLTDVRTPAGWVNDVADGKIDAIATAQPYANAARDRLGTEAVVLPLQSSQPLFALVISTDNWISAHQRTAERFLASLEQAEGYAQTHPAESQEILRKRLDLNPGYLETVWRQNTFSLTLDQPLIIAMEDEARWMIANNLTNATTVPEFRNTIYTKSLEEIMPESVRIIG